MATARATAVAATALVVAMVLGAPAAAGSPSGSSHYMAAAVQFESQAAPSGAPRDTLLLNIAGMAALANAAAGEGADVVVFPEFGAYGGGFTGKCSAPTDKSAYCETYPEGGAGANPCVSGSGPASLVAASCAARNASVMASFNLCDARPEGNYNAQLVFGADGTLLANYHKSHPWQQKCFVEPPAADIEHVIVDAPFGVKFGVFTCKDILYNDPAAVLAKQYGIKHFLYSAAIPLIGADAARLFTVAHNVTLVMGNLQSGQTGVFTDGHRLTAAPKSGNQITMAAVLK
uniref:CN hydrolase domain-containing protein n=1 Tax=Bicosoecida sp. CB-2014 TaxID=1486930 RepID=A0A7S1G5Q6_9STRA